MMEAFSLSIPIFIGGVFQLAHDITFYFIFRNVRPPEEEPAAALAVKAT
jgi:hypothetical protein